MNDTTIYLNENLRSISAIVTAQNQQINRKKLSLVGEVSRPSKISKQCINRSSLPANYKLTKASIEQNKVKKCIWKSSKIVPYNNNVFYFDDRSDLALSNILSNRYISTKEDHHRKLQKIKTKQRCKCITIVICLFATLIIIMISTIVSVSLLTPSKT